MFISWLNEWKVWWEERIEIEKICFCFVYFVRSWVLVEMSLDLLDLKVESVICFGCKIRKGILEGGSIIWVNFWRFYVNYRDFGV